ncbi:MAG TPA: hypothetical protein VMU04_16740 [Candidatus Acidoferrum sp.]|nr:hypothetical protein [Candidatus Acidoferrum sp.]
MSRTPTILAMDGLGLTPPKASPPKGNYDQDSLPDFQCHGNSGN